MTLSALANALPVLGAVLFLLATLGAGGARGASLRDSDCAKCHTGPAADLAFAGAAHDEVSCSGCHEGHPPKSEVTIPACSQCHSGGRHFEKSSCSSCHANPHMPLRVTMSSATSDPCRECHPAPVALISRGGSGHSDRSCSDCHPAHRQVPACSSCHEPHSLIDSAPACTSCHQAHMPAPVIYSFDVPDRECATCHPRSLELLRAGGTGHGRKACVFCHRERHGAVQRCASCHGLPHRLSDEALFADCGGCHRTAHDLDVWPGERTAGGREGRIPPGILPFLEQGKADEPVQKDPGPPGGAGR